MPVETSLSKSEARCALVAWHFQQGTIESAFQRLRSIQFDPIAPVGCNHDLVLQSRVPGYRIGDWHKAAYEDRLVYDGWDKQASLVLMQGWPLRRAFHDWHRPRFHRIFQEHAHAVEAVLKELEFRGPLHPKEFHFQERKDDWQGSWFGPSLTKQTLRALWHSGDVMTAGRRSGHHVYDLTQRIVPAELLRAPKLPVDEAVQELVLERHRAVGMLRATAPQEVWSFNKVGPAKRAAYERYSAAGDLVPVTVEGMQFYASAELMNCVGAKVANEVRFIAPLDQLMWDRKAVAHLFGFEYIWEIYVPEPKRRWGYYVLPVLFGDAFVARAEFWCRSGELEIKTWQWEPGTSPSKFWPALEEALRRFARYAGAERVVCGPAVDAKLKDAATVCLK